MRYKKCKRILGIFVCLLMAISAFPVQLSVAAETPSVTIVGFISGNTTGLRSSELLQAKVEGYDAPISELTFKWTNNLGTTRNSWFFGTNYYGTYLYVYNSHNMYTVQGTESEQEIYNTAMKVEASDNMTGRTHDGTFSGLGYAYAAVYGANLNNNGYDIKYGNISVEVYHGDTLVGSASYSGFEEPSLQADLDNAVFGVFEGETIAVKDLLGESAIVHVNCEACSVTQASISDGSSYISLNGSAPNYTVTGVSKGTATISITVEKDNCKFHQYTEHTATPQVHVFKKPHVTPGLTTLTLTNLDPDCTYYIAHQQGVRSEDGQTVVFEGLSPSTTYEIEVHGHYTDDGVDKVAYAFVNGTTLTPNIAAVLLHLDGAAVTAETLGIDGLYLYAMDANGNPTGQAIPLIYSESHHNYTAEVINGIYRIYDSNNNAIAPAQEIVINGANASTTVNYYTVTYDTDSGTLTSTPSPQIYFAGSEIIATNEVPKKSGYYFTGWSYNGSVYQPHSVVNRAINAPMTLTAMWQDAIDITVHLNIDHISDDGSGHNSVKGRHNITFTVDGRENGSVGDYTELAKTTIEWDGVSDFDTAGYEALHTVEEDVDLTTYTPTAPTFRDIPTSNEGMEYTITTNKSGYTVTSITSQTEENGDITFYVDLVFNPHDFDLYYEVELDEEAKQLPVEMKPVAANVKITSWYDSPYVDGETVDWYAIVQHQEVYEQVAIDPTTGKGADTYPVWIRSTDGDAPYHYRIEVVSYVLPDRSIVPAMDKDNAHIQYITSDERYTATIEITDGQDPQAGDSSSLTGAWYEDTTEDGVDNPTQQGAIKAWISIKKPTLTLHAFGGTIGTTDAEIATIPEITIVPDLSEYTPVRDGYAFGGWYTQENVHIVEGTLITQDVTAWAYWIPLQRIEGTVTVEHFYYINDVQTEIPSRVRIGSTEVLLRRRPVGTDTFATVKEQVIQFDTTALSSTADFVFEDIPTTSGAGTEYEYIVVVRQANYDIEYTPQFTYTGYDVDGQTQTRYAAKPVFENGVGQAHAYLSFAPQSFVLPFKVDTTLIQDPATRPIAVTVVYEHATANSDLLEWHIISQHTIENGPLKADITDGYATGSYPVWNRTPDGQYEYFYRLKVVDYTLPDGTVVNVSDDTLFNIYHNDPQTFSSADPIIIATFSPRPLLLTLDTGIDSAILGNDTYHDAGSSTLTEGELYAKNFVYGTGIPTLPTPVKEGHSFIGWFDELGNEVTSVATDTTENVYLTARWEEGFTVNFISNNRTADRVVFRSYYLPDVTLPSGDNYFHLNEAGQVNEAFYDIPTLSYENNNLYIFKGWYLDAENDNDTRPLTWDIAFAEETNIYAHWIYVGTVAKEAADGKDIDTENYNEYDLLGVQIRSILKDSEEYNGTTEASSGLRFITVLSENVYDQLLAIHSNNTTEAEYGFVIAKTATAHKYQAASADPDNYQLHYKSGNVNGVNTSTSYKYVQNVKGSGVADHYNGENYRLYTAVVTFKNKEGDALAQAQAQYLLARPYLRYRDANGLYRTHYNNYTGTAVYHGCSASYSEVYSLLGLEE